MYGGQYYNSNGPVARQAGVSEMKSISYQEKLSRQFTRYAAGMVTVFFAVFTMILLIYTLGINGHRNEKYNRLLSDSFTDTYDRYAEFLLSPGAAEQFSRRLSGEISDNFLSYYYNSFNLSAGMQSGLILSDASGGIVYCGVDDGYPGSHLRYFNYLVQNNLAGKSGIYSTVYSLYGNTSRYVLSAPLFSEDGSMAGAASIYIDGAKWEELMRQEQFDGVITDAEGYIIASSNRTDFAQNGISRFQPDSSRYYTIGERRYVISTTYLPDYQVYVHTFLMENGVSAYYVITLCALAILLFVLLATGRRFAMRIANLNSRSLNTLHDEINAIQGGNVVSRIHLQTGDEFEDIADHINLLLDHLESLNSRNLELARLNNQMERLQLEAQFDPHFLYNTLESIRYAIRLGDRDVDGIILRLTSILRYSIHGSDHTVSLQEDLQHLRDYLEIIRYRFGERFRFQIDIPDACLGHACPKLCLQPIVENSIKYGLQNRKVLTVTVRAWQDEDFLYLEVRDDGLGMSPALLAEMRALVAARSEQNSTHYGLRNIARRLSLQFRRGSGMELDSVQGQGTVVLLRISHQEVL